MNRLFLGFFCALVATTGAASTSELDAKYLQQLDEIFAKPYVSQSRMLRAPVRKAVAEPKAEEQLQALLDAHWGWQMQRSPEWATLTGYPGQDHRWSSQTVSAAKASQGVLQKTLLAAKRIDRKQLAGADRLNLDLFIYDLETDVAGHAFAEELILVTPMYGVHTAIARTLANMPLFTPEQVENYLARLEGIPQVLAESTDTLRAGLEAGVTPPQITLKKVPAQAYGLVPEQAEQSPLLQALLAKVQGLPGGEPVRQRALQIYASKVRPAVLQFGDFLDREYVPGAVKETGLSSLPAGPAWYSWRARKMTTTALSPQQIHEIGLAEVKRIQAAMFAIMDEVGFKTHDIAAFAAYLAKDPDQFYADADTMLRDYRAMAKRADAELVTLFTRYPSLPYSINAIPAHEAAGRSAAYYMWGSAENGRPGAFYVNTSRLAETPKYEMEALLLHEAVPGHHFQLALTQELDALPEFRRHGGMTAFIEGWGLYAESLGHQMGFYQSPESRFGALTYEMWRAIRLVVDTGMHALGWSRQQAIDYFVTYTGRGLNRISAEVDRYLVMPGQALAYKMGELKIQALRRQAEQTLGERFDIREFHDQLLSEGALPLTILESRMNEWVKTQKIGQ